MSDDGSIMGMQYSDPGSGTDYLSYVVKTDTGELVRLGDGDAGCVSPDGKWLVAFLPSSPGKIIVYPTGPGETRHFDIGPIVNEEIYCAWTHDSERFVFSGAESGKSSRTYLVDRNTGHAQALTPEGTTDPLISPDGRFVLARNSQGFALYPLGGGSPQPVLGISPDELPIQWDTSGTQLYVWNATFPAHVRLIDPRTGTGKPWAEATPPDSAGLLYGNFFLTPDGTSYVYRYRRVLSTLYLANGVD